MLWLSDYGWIKTFIYYYLFTYLFSCIYYENTGPHDGPLVIMANLKQYWKSNVFFRWLIDLIANSNQNWKLNFVFWWPIVLIENSKQTWKSNVLIRFSMPFFIHFILLFLTLFIFLFVLIYFKFIVYLLCFTFLIFLFNFQFIFYCSVLFYFFVAFHPCRCLQFPKEQVCSNENQNSVRNPHSLVSRVSPRSPQGSTAVKRLRMRG